MEDQQRVFGFLEPYGYLGAWLSRATDFGSKIEHMRYTPSLEDVCRYLVSRGFIREL
jgi:hypothetical protein